MKAPLKKMTDAIHWTCALAFCVSVGIAYAADWPKWRGPDENGISKESGWRLNWKDAEPRRLWTADVKIGFSSFVVADGKLYTMGYEGPKTGGKDIVFCLDAATGKEIWTHTYTADLDPNLYEGGPNATPTIDGEFLYTLGKQGQLFCLNKDTGKVVWKADLKAIADQRKVPDWGFSSSPYILGDKVIVDGGRTVAFDKNTGKVLWRSDNFRPGYGAVIGFKPADRQMVAVLNNDALVLLDASDGSTVTRQAWRTSFFTSSTTPIVEGNRIFISTGYDKGAALFEFTNGQLKDVYRTKTMRNHFNNSVLYKGVLYGVDGQCHRAGKGDVVCIDFATGEEKWRASSDNTQIGCGSLMIADGKMIILGDRGLLVVAEASPAGYKELARMQVFEGANRCWTVPVLANGRIYCRTADGKLVCLDVSGAKADAGAASSPAATAAAPSPRSDSPCGCPSARR